MKLSSVAGLLGIGAFLLLSACETPSRPDFSVDQRNNIPIIKGITYEFLGGKGSIIDTTSSSFQDLFELEGDGTVRIVQELEFEIGDLGSAIPEIDVDPIIIESQIGDIVVDDFNANFESEIGLIELDAESTDPENAEVGTFNAEFSGSGQASYEEITGNQAGDLPAGSPIPEGQSPEITILLDVGDFQEAVIESGAIRIVFRNELGFQVGELTSSLISNGSPVSSQQTTQNITHGSTREIQFPFDQGDLLQADIEVRITVSWDNQNTVANAGDLVVQEAGDVDLVVSRAIANVPQQIINPSTPDLEISNSTFIYAIASDSGDPNVNSISVSLTNQTNLTLSNSSFDGLPTITLRNSDGDILDQTRNFVVQGNVSANTIGVGETAVAELNLSGQKLTKVLTYTLDTGTPGGNGIEVNASDLLIVSSATSTLELTEAFSDVDPQSNIELSDEKEVDGDFVNAEVERGTLRISFTNESQIPLEIDELIFYNAIAFRAKNTGRFFETGSEVGRLNNVIIPPNSFVTQELDISGRGISNRMRYDGLASSPGTSEAVEVNTSDLIITDITGEVTLSSATAILDAQDFFSSGTIEINDDEFKLSRPEHFIEIKSGILNFASIINNIDLDIDTLVISFPDIRMPGSGFGIEDSLVISFVGNERILRRTANSVASQELSLAGHRIYALDNKIDYNVYAITESTRGKVDEERTVQSTDILEANVEIDNLSISRAFGQAVVKTIRLNDEPDTGDASLDLFNDNVAQITNVEELEELSRRITNIQFFNPSLNLTYSSNIGVDADIYAAILGVNESGDHVMLTGRNNSDFQVNSTDTLGGFFNNGSLIPSSDLVKFRITAQEDLNSTTQQRTVSFDSDNSNVDDFLSNLPTSIRFVGKALINPESGDGFLINPIDFSTTMGIDVPLNFATGNNPGITRDTLEVDLADLPGDGDDIQFTSARMLLNYTNSLPLELEVEMQFLDENYQLITQAPFPGRANDGPYIIGPSEVDATTAFATQPNTGVLIFNLGEDQLKQLNRTKYLALEIKFQSTRGDEVKIRATDTFTIGLNAEFSNNIRVN